MTRGTSPLIYIVFLSILCRLTLPGWAGAAPADRPGLHWASDGDALSMDPYTRNELQQLSLTGNVYEPLVQHGVDGTLEPVLALAWEQSSPLEWTFHLRPGVRWQDGSPFSADDVLFSLERVQSATSLLRSVVAAIVSARRVDDLTVVFTTGAPDPTLPHEVAIWYIMSRAWALAHDAARPALLARAEQNFATRHAMGTGPYRLGMREPDQRTTFEANTSWWGDWATLPADGTFDVLTDDATRVAALLAGDLDLVTSLPPADVPRIQATAGLRVVAGPELRTIFLGMDQVRDQLLKSDVVGRNPFRDARVREAVALAIDENAIVAKLMRGLARPTWMLWGPGVVGYDAALDNRPVPDPVRARALLGEAGFPDGFGVTLDCPTDRYVMDAEICTALVPMLGRIGIRVALNVQPKARFFAEIGPPDYRTSFYLLGWTPASYDAHEVLQNLLATRGPTQGAINFGGFSDGRMDALTSAVSHELDPVRRGHLIDDAARLAQSTFAYIPLHQQRLLWGVRDGIDIRQPPDGMFRLRLASLH